MTLPVTYLSGFCLMNAYINQRHAYKEKGLKMKIGSLAINGWWEYGGENWKQADFARTFTGDSCDFHAWLEDAEGNVYDCAQPWFNEVAKIRTGRPLTVKGKIEGKSKEALSALGLTYKEADVEAQAWIAIRFAKRAKEIEAHIVASHKAGLTR